jgi:hypothetical protein
VECYFRGPCNFITPNLLSSRLGGAGGGGGIVVVVVVVGVVDKNPPPTGPMSRCTLVEPRWEKERQRCKDILELRFGRGIPCPQKRWTSRITPRRLLADYWRCHVGVGLDLASNRLRADAEVSSTLRTVGG